MKKFGTTVAAIVAALALMFSTQAPEAEAHYQAPGTWFRSYANCVSDSVYGNFGGVGFAQFKIVDTIGAGCTAHSQVGVTTVAYGYQWVKWCNVYTGIFNPDEFCSWSPGTNTLQVTLGGTAISYATIACQVNASGQLDCVRQDHGAFMPAGPYHTPPQF